MPESQNMRIMIVHFIPDTVKRIQVFLERKGYLTETAHNGAEALSKMQAEPPDVMICSLYLSETEDGELGYGGAELIKTWRDDPRFADLPIILTTPGYGLGFIAGYDRDAYISEIFQRSVDKGWRVNVILWEPLRDSEIFQVVKRVIELTQASEN